MSDQILDYNFASVLRSFCQESARKLAKCLTIGFFSTRELCAERHEKRLVADLATTDVTLFENPQKCLNFPPIFCVWLHFLTASFRVSKTRQKLTIFGIFSERLSTHNVNAVTKMQNHTKSCKISHFFGKIYKITHF